MILERTVGPFRSDTVLGRGFFPGPPVLWSEPAAPAFVRIVSIQVEPYVAMESTVKPLVRQAISVTDLVEQTIEVEDSNP